MSVRFGRTVPFFLVQLLLLLAGNRVNAQRIDLNGNNMSDIWELLYGASALDPNADSDGDGVPNVLEALAGTDPFDPNSVPKISLGTYSGGQFAVTIASQLGKQYQLQSVQPAGPGGWSNWVAEVTTVARTGSVATLTAPVTATPKFFRIAITDVDTDGDGVNDWEEYQLGLDPLNPNSNGQVDLNGQAVGDYAYVVGQLASQNVITISAPDPVATQPDPNQTPLNVGAITLTRGGFPLRALTVNVSLAGPGAGFATESLDFAALPRSIGFLAGLSSVTIPVTPLANSNLASSVIVTMKLQTGSGYTLGLASNASVIIYPSVTPRGTGLTGQYYTNANPLYSSSANFNPANLRLTRTDTNIDFTWGTTSIPIANNGWYSVRWTGQVQPQYSETYYFAVNSDDGVKLWVNDQLIIDNWVILGSTNAVGTIPLQAGVRYNLKMDYFQATNTARAHLYWYSPSQPQQVIPTTRLYPSTVPPSPTVVVSPLAAYAFLGQPFSFAVVGANSANSFTASGLPPGLALDSATGLISGTPNLAGDFEAVVTASNSVGLSAAMLDIQVIDTGSSVVRELWTNVPGTTIDSIPLTMPASQVTTLGTLEGITGFGQNYGERIRGFFTAPATGNYYFWIAASDSAELWISNNSEPVNKVRRAYVAPGSATAPRQWNLQPNQKSGWLSMVAGQKYYLEILHKAGTGTNDNWSVAWLQDPLGTNNIPNGVVPGYVLGRYYPPPPSYVPGTLYTANLLASPGVSSTAVGSATLRVSADGSQAILKVSYTGLSSALTGGDINSDPYLSNPSQPDLFDIGASIPNPDGSFLWYIIPVGPLSTADILEIIREGKLWVNLTTTAYPNGEISGHFTLANGSQNFSPPPSAPAWTDDHSSSNAAARFLIQATFGPNQTEIANVQSMGYLGWINNQFSLPPTHHLPVTLANVSPDPTDPYDSALIYNTWWQQSITAPDQLRQRLAFALSEIMVTSQNGALQNNARTLSSYYDTLLDNAFGNFRSLLKAVTLTPAMGDYLNMRGNDKGSLITGVDPNENYAREWMQLFSVGLYRLWPDGSLVMDSQGNLVPTYDQNVIMGMARVLTGWNYWQANQASGLLPTNWLPKYNPTNSMVLVPTHHELGTKLLLDNVMLPAAQGNAAVSGTTNNDAYCSQDLDLALDSIFNHQNVGPFICRQLIQRLVTSNPSRDYLYRVVQIFNDNGAGVRGDLQAVIRAILLDYEARSSALLAEPTFGKQREPLLRATAAARAFPAPASPGGTYSQNNDRPITITTASAHRLNNGDTVFLTFTDTSGQAAPSTRALSLQTTPTANTFTVNAPGLNSGTYSQVANTTVTNMLATNTITTNAIFVTTASSHGLVAGNPVYLLFTTGGASNGVYQVLSVTNSTSLIVATADATDRSGTCYYPKFGLTGGLTSGGYSQSGTTINISTYDNHSLNVGDSVFIHFKQGSAPTAQYQVTSVPDPSHFTVTSPLSANQTYNNLDVFPLVPPPILRSGTVLIRYGTWNIGATDSGATYNLSQSPLNSPTVFNFFFPSYRFPGQLASAGLTTPEFQLTSDTSVALQMNFLEGGTLNNNNNTNGVTSFNAHGGAIVLDLGPWMTPAYTADSGVPSLVDALNTLLLGGQLSADARTTIVSYVQAAFPVSSSTYKRDRVQAIVHLLLTSPDFTIQK